MSQHDLEIANQTFPATRSDLNNALQALGSNASGTTAPSTTYAHQFWMDTTNDILKIRNANNDAWIELFAVDQVNDIITLSAKYSSSDDGSQSSPPITFASDTDTGIFRIGANQLGITTGGSTRVIIDGSGDLTLQNGTPALKIKDVDSTGSSQVGEVQFVDSSDAVGAAVKLESSELKLQVGGTTVASFGTAGNNITPTGSLIQFAGSTAPTGWLVCDGSAVSRSTYSELFSTIGTVYGAGDGSTTFNLPDLQGRTPIGAGSGTGLSTRTLGGTGGAEAHTLTVNEMPSHTHTFDMGGGQGATIPDYDPADGNTSLGTATTNSTGGGAAHNNMQPFLVLNFIIKT